MEAREIMTRDVIAAGPDMTVDEAADLLMHYRIHGAPVVDDAKQVIGMISFMDLASGRGKKVRDVMATDPVYASEDTPVEEIAAAMLEQRCAAYRSSRVGASSAWSAQATLFKCS